MPELSQFGERVEQLRKGLQIEVADLCRRVGISRCTYYRTLERPPERSDTVALLAIALGTTPAELLTGEQLAPTPEQLCLLQCRDLLLPDGTSHPARFRQAVELAWRARFARASGPSAAV